MNQTQPQNIRRKEGRNEATEVFVVTPETYMSCSVAQLGPGRPATLTTRKQKVVFCFQGFLPGGCSAGTGHWGAAVSLYSVEQLRGRGQSSKCHSLGVVCSTLPGLPQLASLSSK